MVTFKTHLVLIPGSCLSFFKISFYFKKDGKEMGSPNIEYLIDARYYRELFHVAVANVAQPLIQKTSRERVSTQELRPWIGSPVGNQACFVPRLR